MSYQDAIADFIAFMEANGVSPTEPIAQRLAGGNLIRFRCEGDGKTRKNGWAILYLDERPAGAFGNYRLNTGTLKWKSSDDRPALSAEERQALQREWREKKEQREQELRSAEYHASLDAADMWQRARPAMPEHGYAERKGLEVGPLRQIESMLLVPMFDASGTLWNLQRIWPDGSKRFLKGARVDDLFCIIGKVTGDTREVVLAEGYATADTIHRATGHPCVVTFTAKNMVRVSRLWNDRRPDINYTIFADDDAGTAAKPGPHFGKNPGIEAAEFAAAQIGAAIAYPRGRAA